MLFRLFTLGVAATAALTGALAAQKGAGALTSERHEVLLDIVARDKHGRLIRDLTAGDLHVTDGGAEVKPVSFRQVTPGDAADPGAPPRLLTLLFERFGPEGRALAREGAAALLKAAAGPNVYFAVLAAGAGIEIEQAFTQDPKLVRTAIDRATAAPQKRNASRAEETLAHLRAASPASAERAGTEAVLARILINVADPSVDAARREALGNPSLQALSALARELGAIPGRKTLVYFCEGLQVPESQSRAFSEILQTANRSNLSIYPVDVSGLDPQEATSPTSPATGLNFNKSVAGAVAMVNGGFGPGSDTHRISVPDPNSAKKRWEGRGTLAELAAQTGGFLVSNTNAIGRPARRIAEESVTYYEIAYVPPETPLDGQFRPIAVKADRADVVVQSRNGYLALPTMPGRLVQSFEVPLLKELDAQPGRQDFYHASSVVPLRQTASGIEHAILVQALLGDLQFEDDGKGGVCRAHGAVLAVVRDGAGKTVDRFSLDNPFQGPLDRKESYLTTPWLMEERIVLAPGAYTLDTVVADLNGGRVSVWRRPFRVEPWDPASGPQIGSLVYARNVLAAKKSARRAFQAAGKAVEPQLELHLPAAANGPAGAAASLFFTAAGGGNSRSPVKVEMVLSHAASEVARGVTFDGPLSGETALMARVDTATLPPGVYQVTIEATQDGRRSTASLPLTIDGPAAAAEASGRVNIVARQPADWDSSPPNAVQEKLIEAARRRALGYTENLPNFVCLQTTRRLEDPTGAREWRQKDEYSEMVTWYHGIETYGRVTGRGRPMAKSEGKVRVTSAGEFGSLLRTIFLPESKAAFRWIRSESIAGRSTDVFSYQIEEANSQYHVKYLGKHSYHATPAYHGVVSIDSNTAEVVHLEAEMGDLPDEIRLDALHITVDYDIANVAGSDYLLPSTATLTTRVGDRHLVRNELRFTAFRRFEADSRIRYTMPPPQAH